MNGADRLSIERLSGPMRPALTVGLVNNMPPAACSSTERQFRQVLTEAGCDQVVNLRCFRTSIGDAGAGLAGTEAIFEAELDGVIVTGAEPLASDLRDEPIWPLITRLADWAEEQALPVVWSCLAAHAAILYRDGIDRIRLDSKISGLFPGEVVATDHPLVQGLANAWTVPHSRCNDLPEETLAASGYQILVRSPGAGVDLFQKVSNPGFVFLQSHPEYDADSLRREFHRDVKRFLAGERLDAPAVPQSYFGSTAGLLPALPGDWSSVRQENAEAILAWLTRCGDKPARAPWRNTAVTFYRNWLTELEARKIRRESHDTAFCGHFVDHHDLEQAGLVAC